MTAWLGLDDEPTDEELEALEDDDGPRPLGPRAARRVARFCLDAVPDPVAALWGLRMLCDGRLPPGRHGARDDLEAAAALLGQPAVAEVDQREAPALLRELLVRLEGALAGLDAEARERDTLLAGARRLGRLAGLGELDCEVLALLALGRAAAPLGDLLQRLEGGPTRRQIHALAAALAVPAAEVSAALSLRGPLARLEMLERRDSSQDPPIAVAPDVPALLDPSLSDDDLLHLVCPTAPRGTLTLEDYPHLGDDLALVAALLRGSLTARQHGVNVLLYGPPGTGKTELAAALARALGARLHSVAADDAVARAASTRSARLTHYALSQRLLAGAAQTLLVFDEFEDAFPWLRENGWMTRRSPDDKARTNRMLESNPVPCIWVGNLIGHLDAAFLRRFSLVVRVPVPPLPIRRSILRRYLTGIEVSDVWIADRARCADLTPADAEAAARVYRVATPTPADAEAALERVLDQRLEARGGRRRPTRLAREPFAYDLSLLNVDCDVEAMLAGLRTSGRARILLHGPPGTGKTRLVARLAEELGGELVTATAGDLLDPYVGGTERQLRELFDEAERSRCVLFLDEADGLLRSRAVAHHGWEVTQVNELLVRMEQFDGVLVCATNLPDGLDRAALRRFDLRIGFRRPTLDQRVRLAALALAALGAPTSDAELTAARTALGALTELTPGDFAAVVRGAALVGGRWDLSRLVEALGGQARVRADTEPQVAGFGRMIGAAPA